MSQLTTQFEEVQLIYRNRTTAKDRPSIKCPLDAFNILSVHWDKDQIALREECKLLLLDNKMRLMSIAPLSSGGMTEVNVDPRMVFSIALKRRSHAIILAHNHPTGGLEPSNSDISLTKRIVSLGDMMRIPLQDHLIITEHGYHSIVHEQGESFSHG